MYFYILYLLCWITYLLIRACRPGVLQMVEGGAVWVVQTAWDRADNVNIIGVVHYMGTTFLNVSCVVYLEAHLIAEPLLTDHWAW